MQLKGNTLLFILKGSLFGHCEKYQQGEPCLMHFLILSSYLEGVWLPQIAMEHLSSEFSF